MSAELCLKIDALLQECVTHEEEVAPWMNTTPEEEAVAVKGDAVEKGHAAC